MRTRFQHLFDRVVVLRHGEHATAWLMFSYSFLVMTAYNVIKPITRSKAIAALGADNLPYVLVGAAIAIGSLMHIYSWGAGKMSRRLVAPATQAGLALVLVAFWVLFRSDAAWVSAAFYVFGLTFGLLLVSQFWTLANDLYDSRQARRLFGFIGGGAGLGGVTGAAITTFSVRLVGSDNLTLVSASILLVCAVTVLAIGRARPVHKTSGFGSAGVQGAGGFADGGSADAFRLLRGSRHLQLIALIVATSALGAIFVEQQLNMAVGESGGSTDEITRLLGQVTMYLSIAGFLVQVGLTSRLHRSFGLAAALLLLPFVLGASSIVILATGAVWAAALARVFDTSLRYSVDRTTREVLFLPLPPELTQRVKPFVDVTVERFAKGIGALILLGLIKPWGLGLTWQQLSYANLIVVAAWTALAIAARREYLATFRRNLQAHVIEPEAVRVNVADARTIELLAAELGSTDERSVLYAIDMLETSGRLDVLPAHLLDHSSALVRARALQAIGRPISAEGDSQVLTVRRLMTDTDAGVRAAAVRALATLQQHTGQSHLRPHLDDPSSRVAAAAAVELADSGNPDDEMAAEATLARLVGNAADREGREHAAAALARIRNPEFRSLLVPLIHDRDVSVAEMAITSASTAGAVGTLLVPALVSRLGHRVLKQPAREALVGCGESVVDVLAHVMADTFEHIWVRRHIPATLSAIPCRKSADALVDALNDPDSFLRFKSITALERMRRTHPDLRVSEVVIEARLLREAARYCELLTLRQNLVERAPDSNAALLLRALGDKLARSLDRVFRLLGLLYEGTDVPVARYALDHGNSRERASALEYLDQVMSGAVRKRVMPIIDEGPISEKVRHANRVAKTRPRDIPDTLALLFHDGDAVVAAAAVLFARAHGLHGELDADLGYLMTKQTTPQVVQQAARWARGGSDAELSIPTVELVDRLRSVPAFMFVSVDELFRIAERAKHVRYDPATEVYKRGIPPVEVLFLLTGAVRTTSGNEPAVVVTAPAAFNLVEAIVGRPLAESVVTVEEGVGLTLDASSLLTLLADDSAAAQGLFRMLLGSDDALERAINSQLAEAVESPAEADIATPELSWHLRKVPLFNKATAGQLQALAAVAREVPLLAGDVLWDDSREPALHYLLAGDVRIEGAHRPSVEAGSGRAIGGVETLAAAPAGRRAVVSKAGRALRISRHDLFEVLADHSELLQGVFASVLDSGVQAGKRSPRSVPG